MTTVRAYAGAGDRLGPAVSDPLIGSEACAVARGRGELMDHAYRRQTVTATGPAMPAAATGHLVRLYDPMFPAITARVTGVTHRRFGAVGWTTELALDRPLLGSDP